MSRRPAHLAALPAALLLAAACSEQSPVAVTAAAARPSLAVSAAAPQLLPAFAANEARGARSSAWAVDGAGTAYGETTMPDDAVDPIQWARWGADGVATPIPMWPDDPAGVHAARVYGVSPNGQWVVGMRDGLATVWTPGGESRPVGEPALEAWGANDRGWIVGRTSTHAFLYRDGVVELLPQPAGAQWRGWATGINAGGDVSGHLLNVSTGVYTPVVWRGGALVVLGGPSVVAGQANDVNDAGEVVGYVQQQSCSFFGCVQSLSAAFWAPDGALTTFGPNTIAFHINNRSQVAGNLNRAADGYRPYVWTKAEGVNGLPAGDGCMGWGAARPDINDDGVVVGAVVCGGDPVSGAPTAARWRVGIGAVNRAPDASAGGPYTAAEGALVALSGSATDPDGDALAYAWDLDGDGTYETPGAAASRTFADNGTYTVRFRATDARGLSSVATATVTVANRPPVVKTLKLVLPTLNTPRAGQSFSFSFVFTDPGVNDGPWAYTIEWGDGETTVGSAPTPSEVGASHKYAVPGTRTVRFTITDKDGASAVKSFPVIVGTP